MFRHYLIAALRNMAANRLQTAIAVLGLSIGVTAAILMALVIRNKLTIDHYIPGYERVYEAVWVMIPPDRPPVYGENATPQAAALLKLNIPEIEITTRVKASEDPMVLRHGNVTAWEKFYWADPNIFDVLPLPVLYGDLHTALSRPDGIVLPRAAARKYFGRDDVVGQTILVGEHPMIVRAVIGDLPPRGTNLHHSIFASGLASFSGLAAFEKSEPGVWHIDGQTFVRLKPGVSAEAVEQKMSKISGLVMPGEAQMPLVRIDQIDLNEGFNPGGQERLAIAGLLGFLILFIAAVNFVNLLTARAARRAQEVGIRKACGAERRALIVQFLVEAILTVFASVCIAMALTEILLTPVNDFIDSGAVFDYGRDPVLLACMILGTLVLGLLAGAYPAFVLSAFRPANVMKAKHASTAGGIVLRNILVTAQFAILVVLIVAAMVVYRQHQFAMRNAMRVPTDQILVVRASCPKAFKTEVGKLPGVRHVVCTGDFLNNGGRIDFKYRDVQQHDWAYVHTGWSVFSLYGLKPIAGALPPGAANDGDGATGPNDIVLNQTAVKRLGFASPQEAIGKRLSIGKSPSRIIAVVRDFSFYTIERPIDPTLFYASLDVDRFGRGPFDQIQIKLDGRNIPETLGEIDRLWFATGAQKPIDRFFLDEEIQRRFIDMLHLAQFFAVFSGVAIFLACLGLVGLSVSTAERRTKDIGVRKAMGATSGEILALLLSQFSRPVMWANLIAWPVAWGLMNHWLNGFAYHVPLSWWLFPAAGLAALLIALVTVTGQAWLVARQKPVLALRYE